MCINAQILPQVHNKLRQLSATNGDCRCLENFSVFHSTDAQTDVVNGNTWLLLRSRCGHSQTNMDVCNHSLTFSLLTNLRNWTPRQQVARQPVILCKVDRLTTSASGPGNAEDCCTKFGEHKDRQRDTLLLTRRRFLLGSATAAGSLGSLPLQHLRLLSLSAIIVFRPVALFSTGLLVSHRS